MSRLPIYPQQRLSNHPDDLAGSCGLLSIDGGGVRGLCSLLVLHSLMQKVEEFEVSDNPNRKYGPRLPCDYFELAGGTSTGGLIAIMLFRLRMDTETAIAVYKKISPKIFKSSFSSYIGGNAVKAIVGRPWFKGETLEKEIKRIVQDNLPHEEKKLPGIDIPNATLLETSAGVHKMFVCALKTENNYTVRLRNYNGSTPEFEQCTIWEAARATSAAPFYFPTAKVKEVKSTAEVEDVKSTAEVKDVKFWDGGLQNNNPINEVLHESGKVKLAGHEIGKEKLACVVSLGTGFSERKPSKSIIPALGKGKRIMNNLTDVESKHRHAVEDMKKKGVMYFRFNPSTAKDNIGLAEYRKMEKLEKYTLQYLNQPAIKSEIKLCAKILVCVSAHRSQTPLSLALETGDEALLRLVLDKGANLETQDSSSQTPLSWAAEIGHELVVKLLLEKGVNLETENSRGRTPLSWAAENGHKPVVKLLLEKGANFEDKDSYGRAPLSFAARNGHEPVVKLLLNKGANFEDKGSYGWTPLSLAARNGHEPVVKLLLEKGANLEDKGKYGWTPLSLAARNGHKPVVKLLLEKGANLETKTSSGGTPLSWAARNEHEPVVKLLLKKGANFETKDSSGESPLSFAAGNGYESVVKLLLEKGANLETKDSSGQTPLSLAAENGHEPVVRQLLEKGASLETKTSSGETPLSLAAGYGRKPVVKLLLEKGAKKS